MTQLRVSVLAVLMSVGVLAGPHPALADWERSTSPDNVVSLENYADHSRLARAGVAVTRVAGDTVANQNVASSYASCTDCRTVGAAIQVVIVESQPTEFRPVNLGVAVNENCLRCQTYAYARQVVLSAGMRMELSDDAEEAIEDISEQARSVVRSRRTFPEMTAALDRLTARLITIVKGEIQAAGTSPDEDDRRDVDEDDDEDDD